MKTVVITTDELVQILDERLNHALAKINVEKEVKAEKELLTRADVALMFKVSYVTVNAWCRNGKLKPHNMNSRVYFLKSEVMAELLKKNK